MREIRIEGYLARDKELGDGFPGELFLYKHEPVRDKTYWKGKDIGLDIADQDFPEVTWEGKPVKCIITITTID